MPEDIPPKRIDKGVKRPRNVAKIKRPKDGLSWTIPKDLNADAVLARYLTEEKTASIAAQYGIRRAALTKWLQKERPKEWIEVQRIRALCRKDDGEDGLYDANSALELSRAREILRAGQWTLERLDPDYRPIQNIQVETKISVDDTLGLRASELIERIRAREIDVTPTKDQLEEEGGGATSSKEEGGG